MSDVLLQFFEFSDLHGRAAMTAAPFLDFAAAMVRDLPDNAARDTALAHLYEARIAALNCVTQPGRDVERLAGRIIAGAIQQ